MDMQKEKHWQVFRLNVFLVKKLPLKAKFLEIRDPANRGSFYLFYSLYRFLYEFLYMFKVIYHNLLINSYASERENPFFIKRLDS